MEIDNFKKPLRLANALLDDQRAKIMERFYPFTCWCLAKDRILYSSSFSSQLWLDLMDVMGQYGHLDKNGYVFYASNSCNPVIIERRFVDLQSSLDRKLQEDCKPYYDSLKFYRMTFYHKYSTGKPFRLPGDEKYSWHIIGACLDGPQAVFYIQNGSYFFDRDFNKTRMMPKTVTPSIRFRIFKRDEYKCRICGRDAEDGIKLEVDHKIPISTGGSNDDENLWTLCFECNRGKATKSL